MWLQHEVLKSEQINWCKELYLKKKKKVVYGFYKNNGEKNMQVLPVMLQFAIIF